MEWMMRKGRILNEFGISSSGLDQIIRTGYHTLGLQSYFTQGPKESRAWTIRKGDLAPQAAGVILLIFSGFIRAQVMDLMISWHTMESRAVVTKGVAHRRLISEAMI